MNRYYSSRQPYPLQHSPHDKPQEQEEPFVKWQERMVDTILRMRERDCSENQIRFWFGEQCDKRFRRL